MKIIIMGMILGLVLLVPMVMGETTRLDLDTEVQALNGEISGQDIPGSLGAIFGDQRINLHLTTNEDEVVTIAIVTEQKKVKSLILAEVKNPTLEIFTSEAVIEDILQAEKPLRVVKDNIDEKKITYKAVGLGNKIKLAFISLLAEFSSASEEAKIDVVERVPPLYEVKKIESPANTETAKSMETPEEKENPITAAVVADKGGEIIENKPVETNHVINLIDGGFAEPQVTIKAGETVEWKNMRGGARFKRAMIIGGLGCSKIKSTFFEPEQSFSWKFEKPGSCLIVDGIYTTQAMKVIVQ